MTLQYMQQYTMPPTALIDTFPSYFFCVERNFIFLRLVYWILICKNLLQQNKFATAKKICCGKKNLLCTGTLHIIKAIFLLQQIYFCCSKFILPQQIFTNKSILCLLWFLNELFMNKAENLANQKFESLHNPLSSSLGPFTGKIVGEYFLKGGIFQIKPFQIKQAFLKIL